MSTRGRVEVIDDSKTGVGKRGKWTLYKVKVDNQWLSAGFERPTFNVGDTIEFATQPGRNGIGLDIVKGSAKVVAGGGSPSPAPAPRQESADSRQVSIVMQHSQSAAIELLGTLLAHSALPITKADTKAGEAKRYEEIVAAYQKLTVQLYNEAMSARLLKFVADTLPAVKADGPVPTPKAKDVDDDLGDDEGDAS